MRDIYYQPVGNTIQMDLLPETRPTLELVTRQSPKAERIARTFLSLLVVLTLPWAVRLVYRLPGIQILEPYDWYVSIPVMVWYFTQSIRQQDFRKLSSPFFLAVFVLVCMNHRLPGMAQIAMISGMLALHVMQFGCHSVALLTVPPVSREAAAACRIQARIQLAVLASIVAWLSALVLRVNSVIPAIAFIALIPALFLIPGGGLHRRNRLRLAWDCIESWFSYDSSPVPGLFQSPAGSAAHRIAMTATVALLSGVAIVRWAPFENPQTVLGDLTQSPVVESVLVRVATLPRVVQVILLLMLPAGVPLSLVFLITLPVLIDAEREAQQQGEGNETAAIINELSTSPDPLERNSLYVGRVLSDNSPVLVPRRVYSEHAHALGDSGAGKTSMFLCPTIEQLVQFGDCSVIVIDLKADSNELFASQDVAAERTRRKMGIELPLRYFSNQANRHTFAFNPLNQSFWSKLDLQTRTDILCGANGLTYGTDYGMGYYSTANASVVYHTYKMFPHLRTFQELADCIGTVLTSAKKKDLHPEIRKAGVHVHEVMKRLAACEALNVTERTGHSDDVVRHSIDLTEVFQKPQLLYFHLSATLSPSGAPEIARLVTYMLLAAATQTERKHPVFLVIDEFQRMVAANLEYMLQLARSMGVGIILANQSMEDLKKSTTNLIPAIEANCRLRQWFSVSAAEDQERLIRSSGLTVDHSYGKTVSQSDNGVRTSWSATEQVVSRFSINDVLMTSDHRHRSFLRISRGDGYAQYGGLPIIVQSQHHISYEESQRRKVWPWPQSTGSFLPGTTQVQPASSKPAPRPDGPVWSQEVIDGQAAHEPTISIDESGIDAFFNELSQSVIPKRNRRRGRPE